MSVIVQTRGEAGGGVAAHLQCPHCGHFSKSHAHQMSHVAASHPASLGAVTVGRLGNILMYQSTAPLFHCAGCFYTCRDFAKLYKHIIARHCVDEQGGGEEEGRAGQGEEEGRVGQGEEEGRAGQGEEEGRVGGGEEEGRAGEGEEEGRAGQGGKEGRAGQGGEEGMAGQGGEEGMAGQGGKEEDKAGQGGQEEKVGQGGEEEEKAGEGGEEGRAGEEEKVKLKEEEERHIVDAAAPKADGEGDQSVLMFDGAGFHCLICSWRTKLKSLAVSHVVKKHDIPKAYAAQAVRHDAAAAGAEEEEATSGLSGELLKEEVEATAKVVRFISNRFVCLVCGWKTKLKGFAISHVVRCHDVERPYACSLCPRSFFLPSRLQQHVGAAHRPGRYACPFCCFRSHFLGGFRRHCSRCNAREEEEQQGGERKSTGGGGGGGGGGAGEEEGEEGGERKERRGGRKRRRTVRVIEEDEEEEEED